MKSSGGRDTFLLFLFILVVVSTACYLLVIKPNFDKLSDVKLELEQVEQTKAKNDAIIKQAEELDAEREKLKDQLQTLEVKLLPNLTTSAIQRKLYKHFDDAHIPFIAEVKNTPLEYELVTLTDGTVSPNRVKSSRYTIKVSGTDGWLLTHDEGDNIPYQVFYTQLGIAPGDLKTENKAAKEYGIDNVSSYTSKTYVGYDEFLAALKSIESENLSYVKINDIHIEDAGQSFCYYTAQVDVFAYELVNRISAVPEHMTYMDWVGSNQIKTGGLVGIPSYFVLHSDNYKVDENSPLYGHYLSFVSYDFKVNRPFAAWNHWAYEWNVLDALMNDIATLPPNLLELNVLYRTGAISQEDFDKKMTELTKVDGDTTTTDDTNA